MDLNLLFFACALVLRVNADKAVGVDIEGDFNLRNAARCGGNADKIEIAKQLIIRRHFALALEYPDCHRALIVVRCRINLALLGRDRRIAINHPREHAAKRFDAKRKRGHVEQENVLDIALQYACLNGGTHRHDFVRIDTGVRFLAKEILHDFANARHPCHPADEHNLGNVSGLHACVSQRLFARIECALDQVINHLL